jgi:hypothetical protein
VVGGEAAAGGAGQRRLALQKLEPREVAIGKAKLDRGPRAERPAVEQHVGAFDPGFGQQALAACVDAEGLGINGPLVESRGHVASDCAVLANSPPFACRLPAGWSKSEEVP